MAKLARKNVRARLTGFGLVVGVAVGSLLSLVLLVVAVFLLAPELEIGSARLRALAGRFAPADLGIGWEDAVVRLVKTDAFSKEIEIRLDGICVRYKGGALDACFEKLEWGAGFSVSGFKPRITFFAPLIAAGGEIAGDLDDLAPEEPVDGPKPGEPGGFSLVDFARTEFLPKWRVDGSFVELRRLELDSGGRALRGRLQLSTAATGAARLVSLRIEDVRFGNDISVDLKGEVDWPVAEGSPFTVGVDLDGGLPGRRKVRARLDGKIHWWDHVDYALGAKFANIPAVREGRIRGTYKGDGVTGLVSAKFGAVHAQVKTLDFVDCGYEVALDRREGVLACGPQTVTVGLRERAELRNRALFRLFPTFDLRVTNLSWENGAENGFAADWDFKLALRHMRALQADLDFSGSVVRQGAADPAHGGLRYSVDGDALVRVLDFGRVVALLRGTPLAVPAPANQLRGSIELNASGGFSERGGSLPFELRTRLRSEFQRLFATVDGGLALNRTAAGLRPELGIDVAIEDVLLSLPRVDVTSSPPKVVSDSRFRPGLARDRTSAREKANGGEAGPGPRYRVRVNTTSQGALKLATNLTGAPIPISVRYKLRSADGRPRWVRAAAAAAGPGASGGAVPPWMEGTISLGRTPVDIGGINKFLSRLERDAVLDHFDLELQPDGGRRIDGKLVVTNPDATISILILGTLAQPVVRFESEPPANEDQIIAALLFGRPINELDERQQQSAAAFRTAVNDTALTLAQMYLLANSPIDSLNYDSESGRVIASVKIAGGTSLEFGGGRGAGTEVGIRRRLARNVYLNTHVERASQTDEQLVSAFVEWVRRF